eukprot:CAMPEP_0119324896 /NCGR_PEP_ID=MMETSP1333-20130426/64460_1 /TAXON_ID=418940 /ORGANISM="Scyphosphaera apsteinii, Strain RCC1455" /LENGTH=123 /DNA_ID=CAMNT_0007332721 /DNA_START=78 /DNA_END=452 /DNA_ORIENTATION=-
MRERWPRWLVANARPVSELYGAFCTVTSVLLHQRLSMQNGPIQFRVLGAAASGMLGGHCCARIACLAGESDAASALTHEDPTNEAPSKNESIEEDDGRRAPPPPPQPPLPAGTAGPKTAICSF